MAAHQTEASKVSPILPPKTQDDELDGKTVRLPRWMWRRLKEIAETDGYAQNDVVIHFVEWSLKQYEAERVAAQPNNKNNRK